MIKVAGNCIESTDPIRLLTTFLSKKLVKVTYAAILDGNQVIYLAKAHAQEELSLMRNIGNHLPSHCTAVKKVLLSQYSDEDIARLYEDVPLEKMTVNSIGTLAVLLAELKQVRQQGYALDQREANERAARLALSLYATNDKMIVAFSITFLAYEWESLPTDEVLQVMKESRAMVHYPLPAGRRASGGIVGAKGRRAHGTCEYFAINSDRIACGQQRFTAVQRLPFPITLASDYWSASVTGLTITFFGGQTRFAGR